MQFADPGKRIALPYLLVSGVIGAWWLFRKKKCGISSSFKSLLNRKVWTSASSRSDILILSINHAIFGFLGPALLGRLTVATTLYFLLADVFGSADSLLSLSVPVITALYTLTYFLVDDWSRYRLHRMLHEIPVLWLFHKVHHSARTLSPFTVYRVHPVEGVLFALRGAIVQGGVTAIFIFSFGQQLSLFTVIGVSVFTFAFNIAGSNLRHSHIRVVYWRVLEDWLISPFQHQLHHSSAKKHFDKNYGSILAVWDRLGGTLVKSVGQSTPRFGLTRRPQYGDNTIINLYLAPFKELFIRFSRFTALVKRVTHNIHS